MKQISVLVIFIFFLFCLVGCTNAKPELSAPLPEPSAPVADATPAPLPSETPTPILAAPTPTPSPSAPVVLDAVQRMKTLTADDIKYISSSYNNVTSQQLADALNGAADHEIDLPEGLPYTFFNLTAYLSGGPDIYSSYDEHLTFYVSLEEDLILMRYRGLKGRAEEYFLEDSDLYWLIRNNYHTPVNIDEDAFARYQSILEERAQRTVDTAVNVLEQPAFNGYDIVSFEYVDSFEADTATYTLYNWDVAFPTDDPANVCWAGGMQLDAECRVRAYELYTYFVVKTDSSGQEDYRFLFWQLYWGETEAERRENALHGIENAFSTDFDT